MLETVRATIDGKPVAFFDDLKIWKAEPLK